MQATVFHQSRHLAQADVQPADQCCPICLATDARQAVYRIQSDPAVDLLHCPACKGCSASHMPTPQVLDDYYGKYYKQADNKVTFASAAKFATHVLKYVDQTAMGATVRIVDFGGGDGTLAKAIGQLLLTDHPDRQIEVDLVDYQQATGVEDPRIRIRSYRNLDEISGKYDLVLASAILEHIPQVNPVFRKLFSLVGPGSFFYARTPYVVPLTRIIPRLDITYPGHVHDMGALFWNRISSTFNIDADIVASGPSVIETSFRRHPLRTTAAYLLKLPARMGSCCGGGARDPWWKLVGGWEVVLRFHG